MTVFVDASALSGVLSQLPLRVAGATAEGVALGAKIFEDAIKGELKGEHAKGTKTSSAVGQPPENISKKLQGSVTISRVTRRGFLFSVSVGPTEFYGKFQERGTKRMEAHPFVKPGKEKSEVAAHEAVVGAWRRVL